MASPDPAGTANKANAPPGDPLNAPPQAVPDTPLFTFNRKPIIRPTVERAVGGAPHEGHAAANRVGQAIPLPVGQGPCIASHSFLANVFCT
jgi:hypothetical protein